MSAPETDLAAVEDERRYLCVDAFLTNLVDARALRSALELGAIDAWRQADCPLAEFASRFEMSEQAGRFLIDLLRAAGVVALQQDRVALTPAFRSALVYRDLLEAKLDFADLVLPDLHQHFTQLLQDPGAFMQESRIFELFRYDRCFDSSAENRRLTQRWVRFTTSLTKYES